MSNPLEAPDPPLTDGVVRLREIEPRDWQRFAKAARGTDVQLLAYRNRYLFDDAQTRSYIDQLRERRAAGSAIGLTVTEANGDELIAQTLLFNLDWGEGIAELGFWAAPWSRGRGVTLRAVVLTSTWAIDGLGFGRVHALTRVDNAGAQAVLERAGFTREGVLRGIEPSSDGRLDQVSYSRLESDPPLA